MSKKLVTVKIQSIVTFLDEESHRFKTIATEPKVIAASNEEEAMTKLYDTYLDADNVDALYATISINGKFVRPVKFGSLDGFKPPGEILHAG